MKITHSAKSLTIESDAYSLQLFPLPHNSFFSDKQSKRRFAFAVGSDCDTIDASDNALKFGVWEVVRQSPDAILLKIQSNRTIGKNANFSSHTIAVVSSLH